MFYRGLADVSVPPPCQALVLGGLNLCAISQGWFGSLISNPSQGTTCVGPWGWWLQNCSNRWETKGEIYWFDCQVNGANVQTHWTGARPFGAIISDENSLKLTDSLSPGVPWIR